MFQWGKIVSSDDPESLGRYLVSIPGMFDAHHPSWAIPVGFPNSGSPKAGGYHPLEVGATVAVLFEMGDIRVPPAIFPAWSGQGSDGNVAGPPALAAHAAAGKDIRDLFVLYDDDTFSILMDREDGNKRLELRLKSPDASESNGARIVFDGADGSSGKAMSITIQSRTGISLETKGLLSLQGTRVEINGRVVQIKPGVTTI